MWVLIENKDIPLSEFIADDSLLNRFDSAGFTQCSRYVAQLAMLNNDYVPQCDETPRTIKAPILVKPLSCIDTDPSGCRQYIVVEHEVVIECTPPDTTTDPGCDCVTITESCLEDGEHHQDLTATCGCVTIVPDDPLNPGCVTNEVSSADCPNDPTLFQP